MKKGQIEIMGLVIIVILLVFIAIFALSFFVKPKQEGEDILKLKANALRASLLKTNLCGNVNVKDELENCVNGYPECGDCSELRNKIIEIINGSLEKEKYYFKFGDIEIGGCDESITAVSQEVGEGSVEIAVCRR